MEPQVINRAIGQMDIYLLDQVLKGKFAPGMRLLDAGCGEGRNLWYFLQQGFEAYGIDPQPMAITMVRMLAKGHDPEHFQVATVEKLPFKDAWFDAVICNAVLHFARDEGHFHEMMHGLVRVLKPGGLLFIRMAATTALEHRLVALGEGRYALPDGSERFLLPRDAVAQILQKYGLVPLEPIKYVVVEDARTMATLVVTKQST
jgi:tellurite methyltransferase